MNTDSKIVVEGKTPKSRYVPKLSEASDLSKFPGVIAPAPKKVVEDIKYYLGINFPVTDAVGRSQEVTQIHDYATTLGKAAQDQDVGQIESITTANGNVEVLLKLNVADKPSDHAEPAGNAFGKLDAYLGLSALLKSGVSGKPAAWKAKVNGSTILQGSFSTQA